MTDLIERFTLSRLPESAERLRADVRAFLSQELPAAPVDVRARSWLGFDAQFSRRLAERGWVGTTLPAAYGGADLDVFGRFVLAEELLCSGAPVAAHWIAERQSGPLILRYGTEAQRRFYLPRICRGEAFFCIGMSEPNSGSDLASISSRADRVDGGWRLNGRKIWSTNAHRCDYSIALVRTAGTSADRHVGLSQFVVDLKRPGITIRPITDLTGDAHFTESFFDDVLLPDDALIGEEGQGWQQVTAELAFERSGPERIYSSIVLLDRWLAWLRCTGHADRYDAEIGRFVTHLAVLREMSIAVTARLAAGESPAVEAAFVKDAGTEFEQAIPAAIEAAIAADPQVVVDPELYRAVAFVSQVAPTYSLRGGTREILRGVIARGLELR
jgi:alkylation response protein AidB-like acyl-CoA dehydrogenase